MSFRLGECLTYYPRRNLQTDAFFFVPKSENRKSKLLEKDVDERGQCKRRAAHLRQYFPTCCKLQSWLCLPVVFEKVVSNLQLILYTNEGEGKSKLFINGSD